MMGRTTPRSGRADFLRVGDFNRICDRCGAKRKASHTRKEWTGYIVCEDGCFETRHPQDFVRARADRQAVQDPRPDHSQNMNAAITIPPWPFSLQDGGFLRDSLGAVITVSQTISTDELFLEVGQVTATNMITDPVVTYTADDRFLNPNDVTADSL